MAEPLRLPTLFAKDPAAATVEALPTVDPASVGNTFSEFLLPDSKAEGAKASRNLFNEKEAGGQ
jgi:hypothetical protein